MAIVSKLVLLCAGRGDGGGGSVRLILVMTVRRVWHNQGFGGGAPYLAHWDFFASDFPIRTQAISNQDNNIEQMMLDHRTTTLHTYIYKTILYITILRVRRMRCVQMAMLLMQTGHGDGDGDAGVHDGWWWRRLETMLTQAEEQAQLYLQMNGYNECRKCTAAFR